jgi:hypothetical protein
MGNIKAWFILINQLGGWLIWIAVFWGLFDYFGINTFVSLVLGLIVGLPVHAFVTGKILGKLDVS